MQREIELPDAIENMGSSTCKKKLQVKQMMKLEDGTTTDYIKV